MTSLAVLGDEVPPWYCHCCMAANKDYQSKKCRVCGRPDSYAQEGYPLPLHGKMGLLFRPSQIASIVENLHEIDDEGWTALHNACANSNVAMTKELLRLDSIVDALTTKGQTPLHLATYAGCYEIVIDLLAHKANVHITTITEKYTPLHLACEGGWKSIAHALVKHGAKVNALTSMERTSLHCAAVCGRTDIAAMLLRNKVDHKAMDVHGWTARQVAELYGHRDFQELMVQVGMREKQPVLKELPVAPWHSELWTEVIKMQRQRLDEAEKDAKMWTDMAKEVAIYREREARKKQEELARQRASESAAAEALALTYAAKTPEEIAEDQRRQLIADKKKAKADKLNMDIATTRANEIAAKAAAAKAAQWPRYAYHRPPPLSLLGYDPKSRGLETAVMAKRFNKRHRRGVFPLAKTISVDEVVTGEQNQERIEIEEEVEQQKRPDAVIDVQESMLDLALGGGEDDAGVDLTVGNMARLQEEYSLHNSNHNENNSSHQGDGNGGSEPMFPSLHLKQSTFGVNPNPSAAAPSSPHYSREFGSMRSTRSAAAMSDLTEDDF